MVRSSGSNVNNGATTNLRWNLLRSALAVGAVAEVIKYEKYVPWQQKRFGDF